jgi:hypothetical protein
MKKSLILTLTALLFFRASAQVSVDLTLDQEQFLPAENVPVTVKITNRSGQQLHFGADPKWLEFSVESMDGLVVIKHNEVPVTGEFDLESSQLAIKHVNIEPYFVINKPGRYKITAALRLPGWGQTMVSAPKMFDVIDGMSLWAQEFGVATGPHAVPEIRKYTLQEANYLHSQLRLYVRVSDRSGAQVFKVTPLGLLVAFNQPEAKIDRLSQLHVLWQTGAHMFYYCKVSPDGTVGDRETYDYVNSRPRLTINDTGEVLVSGGVLRMHVEDLPVIHAPVPLPAQPAKPKS